VKRGAQNRPTKVSFGGTVTTNDIQKEQETEISGHIAMNSIHPNRIQTVYMYTIPSFLPGVRFPSIPRILEAGHLTPRCTYDIHTKTFMYSNYTLSPPQFFKPLLIDMVTTSGQFLRLRARYANIFLHEPRWQNLPDQNLPNWRARCEHEITLLTQFLSESEDTDQSTFYQSSLNFFTRRRRAIDGEMQTRTNWRVSREDEILGDDFQLEAAVRENLNALRRRQGLETPVEELETQEEPEDEQFLELNEFLEARNIRRLEEQFNADSEELAGRTRRFEERMHQAQQQIHERAPWLLESPAPLPLLVPTNRVDAAGNVPSLEPELHHNSR
jgi:hypothetical protein